MIICAVKTVIKGKNLAKETLTTDMNCNILSTTILHEE